MLHSLPRFVRRAVIAVTACSVLPTLIAADLDAQDKDSNIHNVTVPDVWRKMPAGALAPIGGYSWYRCLVQVPADWKGAKLRAVR